MANGAASDLGVEEGDLGALASADARPDIHTNTVEGFFSLLKRGIIGTFHHVSKAHLHRYCDEFAFRYTHRSALGVDGAPRVVHAGEGKWLTYKQPSGTRAA
jgi:hypothetical protein